MDEKLEIQIEIVCTGLPGAGQNFLHLGIQRDNEIIEAASADSKRIVFKPTFRARRNDDGSVNFLGAFAQGPKAERFIYLNWVSTKVKVPTAMIGRVKLHLNHLTWAKVQEAVKTDKPIRVTLSLRNVKGKPVMGSVRADVAKWESS